MKTNTESLKAARKSPEYWAEYARSDFIDAMCNRMRDLKISHYRLHKLSGVSKGQISKTFKHAQNITIETMAKMACAVGLSLRIQLPIRKP